MDEKRARHDNLPKQKFAEAEIRLTRNCLILEVEPWNIQKQSLVANQGISTTQCRLVSFGRKNKFGEVSFGEFALGPNVVVPKEEDLTPPGSRSDANINFLHLGC